VDQFADILFFKILWPINVVSVRCVAYLLVICYTILTANLNLWCRLLVLLALSMNQFAHVLFFMAQFAET
jgi:hypothetical protein